MKTRFRRGFAWALALALAAIVILPASSEARTAQEINAGADVALARLKQQVRGSDALLQRARGVLIFPGVIKAGAGIGGEYGEGALRIGGRSAAYYSFASASIGFQLGIQKKDIIILFLSDDALRRFRAKGPREGWQAGVDGSVVLVDVGASASIDSAKVNQPIVGFVVGQKGLMYNLTLEGSKITKLNK